MDITIVLILFIATTIASALILAPLNWTYGFISWFILVLASLLTVVRWHSKNTIYRCPKCNYIFNINMVTDLVSPHGINHNGGWKLLTCPRYKSYVKSSVLKKEKY